MNEYHIRHYESNYSIFLGILIGLIYVVILIPILYFLIEKIKLNIIILFIFVSITVFIIVFITLYFNKKLKEKYGKNIHIIIYDDYININDENIYFNKIISINIEEKEFPNPNQPFVNNGMYKHTTILSIRYNISDEFRLSVMKEDFNDFKMFSEFYDELINKYDKIKKAHNFA
jgi:hypothetical protein